MADGDHALLQHTRECIADQLTEALNVKIRPFFFPGADFAVQQEGGAERGERLRKQRCHGSAENACVQTGDPPQIQQDVENRRKNQERQRRYAVAERLKSGIAHIVEKQKREAV